MNRIPSRDLIAFPAVLALTHAPEIVAFASAIAGGVLVHAAGLTLWLGAPLMVLIGGLASHAVAVLPRRPRPLDHVALGLADEVAAWAGWDWNDNDFDTDPTEDPYEGEVTR